MNVDERIEAALRRRPSDERAYDEPLAALASTDRPERIRPVSPVRRRSIRSGVPALAAVCLTVVLGASLLAVALVRNGTKTGGEPSPIATPSVVPSATLVGCWGNGPGFSPELLSGPADAETGGSPAAAVLRGLLDSGQGTAYPDRGWLLVSETRDEVQFVAKDAGGGVTDYQQVVVKRNTDGQFGSGGWSLSSYGSCALRAVPPKGYGTAVWTLDPSAPFTAGTTELHILVTEDACHSGVAATADRIRADVTYGDTAVVVTVTVASAEGVWACPTAPPAAYVVHLDEPVGNRDLLNGGQWPPVTVVEGSNAMPSSTPSEAPGTPTLTSQTIDDAAADGSWTRVSFSPPGRCRSGRGRRAAGPCGRPGLSPRRCSGRRRSG